jgi:hypothetical protein
VGYTDGIFAPYNSSFTDLTQRRIGIQVRAARRQQKRLDLA